jgi:hypothetical protein
MRNKASESPPDPGRFSQPKYHFNEWFVSIHLFQRIGARSMMEKYDQTLNHLKFERYEAFTTPEQRAELQRITEEKVDGKGVQLPDLFVSSRDESECWFVESKRVGEPVSAQQMQSHDKIRTRLGMRVDTIRVEVIAV